MFDQELNLILMSDVQKALYHFPEAYYQLQIIAPPLFRCNCVEAIDGEHECPRIIHSDKYANTKARLRITRVMAELRIKVDNYRTAVHRWNGNKWQLVKWVY